MYSWGRATDGQLGIGAVEENHILNPTWLKKFETKTIHRVACGLRHTLILVDDKVYSCGSNEKGQLGQEESTTRPAEVPYLSRFYKIALVGCGYSHSVAVTKDGIILSWGDNEFGQLGRTVRGNPHCPYPLDSKTLSNRKVVQVACGAFFNIMLTNDCHVLTWGKNDHGQLGHSYPDKPFVKEPVVCENLITVPVCQIAAGTAHSVAVTRGGYVFTCGRNNFGQLGLGHRRDVGKFMEMMDMSRCNIKVKYAACGEEHTVLLADNGCGYTCGSSRYGQLGHGDFTGVDTPKILIKLIGDEIFQIACGRMHTIVALDTGEVYSFGLNASGQLGHNTTINLCYPTLIEKEWIAGQSYYDYLNRIQAQIDDAEPLDDSIYYMYQLFAGGDQSFVAVTSCERDYEPNTSLRRQKLAALLSDSDYETTEPAQSSDGVSSSTVAEADSSSHPPPRDFRLISTSEQPIFLENHMIQSWLGTRKPPIDMEECVKRLEIVFLNPGCLNGSFHDRRRQCTEKRNGVNLINAVKAFSIVRRCLCPNDNESKMNYIRAVVQKIPRDTLPQDYNLERKLVTKLLPSFPPNPPGYESLKIFYLLPSYMCNPPRNELIPVYIKAFLKLSTRAKVIIEAWFFNGKKDHISLLMQSVQDILNDTIKKSKDYLKRILKENEELRQQLDPSFTARFTDEDEQLVLDGLEFMKTFADWNLARGEIIPITDFHLRLIIEKMDLAEDYFTWMDYLEPTEKIIFCRYPQCLDVRAKARLMLCDCKLHQQIAISRAQGENIRSLVTEQKLTDYSPFSVELNVHRHNLVNNTLAQLMSTDPSNFKKPLKVVFIGEEGDDEGGVKKEFFMLLFNEILNPDFGMFVEDQESHLIWFSEQPLSYENVEYFKMIGILCGLAIYNDVLIDLPFPTLLYRKLLDSQCRLRELQELHPSEAQGLASILEYNELDFSDVYDLTFAVNRRRFGEVKTVQLVEGGETIPVTLRNRDIYVSLYLKYCFHDAVDEPFEHFKEGFMRVCGGKLLELIHPLEMKELLVGKRVTNWYELQEHMQYKNGYTKEDPTIKLFWEVFEEFTDELKRKFLVFLTGSDRIPLNGVEQMHMMTQKMDGGPGCEKLPVAHTCFNVLDLPPYETKDKMKTKLLQAINFTSGFGII